MNIAVVSDIHDHVRHLDLALPMVASCDLLVCCGDLCSPFVLDQLARGFSKPIHIVFGNNDADLFRITSKVSKYPHVQLRGEFFTETWAGRKIAVTHFDNIGRAIAAGGHFDAVFYGHNHIAEVARQGNTLLLNPGSLMGAQFDSQANRMQVAPSFAIYDTAANEAELFTVEAGSQG